jgi:hypothetical protein
MTNHPDTNKKRSTVWNTGNGFDPSSFYGEDEEEEEEEDDDVETLEQFDASGLSALDDTQKETNGAPNAPSDETLSTTQLLDLFGATAPVFDGSPTEPTVHREESSGSSKKETDDFVLPPTIDSCEEDSSQED